MANIYSKAFGDGSGYVCDGDTITGTIGAYTVTAQIRRDDDAGAPDQMQDGFWPSLNPMADGYIGTGGDAVFQSEQAQAEKVMDAWTKDEWWYVGVVVTVTASVDGVELARESIWGVECNYPGSDNVYLTELANELADSALAEARAKTPILAAGDADPLTAAVEAQTAFWNALKTLEKHLGVDVDGTQDLRDCTLESLLGAE
jgi:hypothetical protein